MKTQFHIVVLFLLLIVKIALGEHEPEVIVHELGNNGVSFSGNAFYPQTASGQKYFSELSRANTFELFVTTPGDILTVEFSLDVQNGTVFQDTTSTTAYGQTLGSNIRFPPASELELNPWLSADSAITTPGTTACAEQYSVCPGFENVPNSVAQDVVYFDEEDEGAQTDFLFARITLIADEAASSLDAPIATFTGLIQMADQPVPLVEPFSFTLHGAVVPEPGSLSMLGLGALSLLGMLRRKR